MRTYGVNQEFQISWRHLVTSKESSNPFFSSENTIFKSYVRNLFVATIWYKSRVFARLPLAVYTAYRVVNIQTNSNFTYNLSPSHSHKQCSSFKDRRFSINEHVCPSVSHSLVKFENIFCVKKQHFFSFSCLHVFLYVDLFVWFSLYILLLVWFVN